MIIAGPWGPFAYDPGLPRVRCQAARRCVVLIPVAKASGLCHGCERAGNRRRGRPRRPERYDDELGTVRWCPQCDEWWPCDDEFWYTDPRDIAHCRGCART